MKGKSVNFEWIDATVPDGRDTFIDVVVKSSELEQAIDDLFARELRVPERTQKLVKSKARSRKDKLNFALDTLKDQCNEAEPLLTEWSKKIQSLFQIRDTFAHRSRRAKFDQFTHINRDGKDREIDFAAVEDLQDWFQNQASDEWYIFDSLENAEIITELIEMPRASVIPLFQCRRARGY